MPSKPKRATEQFDQLSTEVSFTFSRPQTNKQMHVILEQLQERLHEMLLECPQLTDTVEHVAIASPLGDENVLEICP